MNNKRICLICGKIMIKGYCLFDGQEYYCSSRCLFSRYTPEEYDELFESDDAYWSVWTED